MYVTPSFVCSQHRVSRNIKLVQTPSQGTNSHIAVFYFMQFWAEIGPHSQSQENIFFSQLTTWKLQFKKRHWWLRIIRLYNQWSIEMACPMISDDRLWKFVDYETLIYAAKLNIVSSTCGSAGECATTGPIMKYCFISLFIRKFCLHFLQRKEMY